MLDAIQTFFMMDDVTFTFAGYALSLYILIALASAVTSRLRARTESSRSESKNEVAVEKPRRRRRGVELGVNAGARFVHFVANLPVSPNQITLIGMALVVFNCALFVAYENTFWLGTGLIAALLFDTLDGLVARTQGTSSRYGGYLDAIVDRYQEVVIYLTLGWVLDQWLPVFLIMTGSMLTSYAKARTALEIDIDNKQWPDLLEKPMRLFILCVGLIGNPTLPWMLPFALWLLAALTHFTALQRTMRARFMLLDAEAN